MGTPARRARDDAAGSPTGAAAKKRLVGEGFGVPVSPRNHGAREAHAAATEADSYDFAAGSGRCTAHEALADTRVALAAPLLEGAWLDTLQRNGDAGMGAPCVPSGGVNADRARGRRQHSGQRHEDDFAQIVLVCEANLSNNIMGALHPNGSLYERPVNMAVCSRQHLAFREALEAEGAHTLSVREVLLHDCSSSVRARVELEDLAADVLVYEMDESAAQNIMNSADPYYVTDHYKSSVLRAMSPEQLIDVILTAPRVVITPSFRDTGFTATYEFRPKANLQFTRDQQIVTLNGIVMARLRSSQRAGEVKIMRYVHQKLGLPVIGEVCDEGAFLEGGDFFPAGEDLCLLGVGLRSNRAAALELMRKDLLGTRRVAVVRDESDLSQDRMHLDCVFNIASDSVCLLFEGAMGDAPTRRLVDVYERAGAGAQYALKRESVEFGEFLSGEGYTIIPITLEEQLAYGCNILNLGGGCVMSCHEGSARKLARTKRFTGNVHYLEFDQITAMYGALHCSSQVLLRTRDGLMQNGGECLMRRRLRLKAKASSAANAERLRLAAEGTPPFSGRRTPSFPRLAP